VFSASRLPEKRPQTPPLSSMSSPFSKSSLTHSLSRNDSMVSQQSASSDHLRGFNGSEVHIPPPPLMPVTMMTAPYQQQPPHPQMMGQQMMPPRQQQQQQQYPPNMPLFQQYLEPEINQINQMKNSQKEMLLFSELKDHQNEVRKIRTSRDLARESSRIEGGSGIGGFFTSMVPRSRSSSPIPMQPQGTEMVGMRSQLQQQPPPQQPHYMQQVQQPPYYNGGGGGGPVIMQQQSQQYRQMSEHSERYMDDSQSRSRDPGVVAAPFHSNQQYNTSRYSSLERPPPPSQQQHGRPQQPYSAQYYNDQSQHPQQQQQQSYPPATQYQQYPQLPPQQFQPNHQPSSDYISFASVPVDYSGQGHHI